MSEITKAWRNTCIATIVQFVRERQQTDIDTVAPRFPFTPKDLDDDQVLFAEVRRVMGWQVRDCYELQAIVLARVFSMRQAKASRCRPLSVVSRLS